MPSSADTRLASKTSPAYLPGLALVTGASSGIGEAIARRFAREGRPLVLAARRGDRLSSLAATLDVPTHLLALDLTDRTSVAEALGALPPEFAEVEVLVNNAGAGLGLAPAQEADLDDWHAMVDVNINALLYVTRALLPGMVGRGRGHVINLGSVAGTYPYKGGNVYGATKAFVEQFSANLRADVVGSGVRVTNIEPGVVETDFSRVRFKGDEARARAVYAGFAPLKADDVAEAVGWCASLPRHVNINRIEMMPVAQACAGFVIAREV